MAERGDVLRRCFRLMVDGAPLPGARDDGFWRVLHDQHVIASVEQQDRLDAELARLVALEPRVAGDTVVLKGAAVQRWWPEGRRRSFGDLELAVRSEDAFWRTCDTLVHRAGYEVGTLGSAYRRRPGEAWAFAAAFVRGAEERQVWIELHHGAFLPSGSYALDLGPVIEEAGGRGACLRVLLAEVSGRALVLRDALDFEFLVLGDGRTPALAGGQVERACADDLLLGQFHRLAAFHHRVGGRELPEEIREALRGRSRPARLAVQRVASRVHRLRERVDEHPLWQRARMSRAVSAAGVDRLGGVVRLLHLGPAPAGDGRWAAGRNGVLFLLTPIGPWVATSSQVFTEEFVERVAAGLDGL